MDGKPPANTQIDAGSKVSDKLREPIMTRRGAVSTILLGGGAVLLAGGGLLGRRAYARHSLSRTLVEDAAPILRERTRDEISNLPIMAREEIRAWFHAPSFNAAEFARLVCSSQFAEELANLKGEESKRLHLYALFTSLVLSTVELNDAVSEIAHRVGLELDHSRSATCEELARCWESRAHAPNESSTAAIRDKVMRRIDPLIRREIAISIELSYAGSQRPSISETVESIGESAIGLLRLSNLGPPGMVIALPLFAINAFDDVFRFIIDRVTDRSIDYQRAISERVASLGNRIGEQFEVEVRDRIKELHIWQEAAITKAANEYARETVGLFTV
ncbi:MAG: hypothetical protein CMK32_06770 [Porticoccaceae bacterium]|nr:hypothetical protein [Porticoccaceae bacterium]